jgi:hypothetical protein
MRRALALWLAILSAFWASGQSFGQVSFRLAGKVRDSSGAIVRDAIVQARCGKFQTVQTTGAEGVFVFESLPCSSGILQISAPGFESLQQPWERQGAVAQLELVLRPAPIEQQVTVTATRTPTHLLDSPNPVVVLSSQELLAAGTVTLDDTLREVPGFSLFRRSGSRTANPTSQGVSLRGLGASGASRALVISGDLPENDPFGGWVFWDRIPHAAIEGVEVSTGGASPLYGSEALGGVVDIIRRTPRCLPRRVAGPGPAPLMLPCFTPTATFPCPSTSAARLIVLRPLNTRLAISRWSAS